MNAVFVLPLGTLDADIAATIEQGIRRVFGLDVCLMNAGQTPDHAFDARRRQYSSELILRDIIQQCPEGALRLLAVTTVDLFIPMLTFVYGQAQLNGRVSLVSTARMHQEFYDLKQDRPLTLSRILKESIHELSHTFGLIHCPLQSCMMSIATGTSQLDAKSEVLCSGCSLLVRDALSRIKNDRHI